MLNGLNGSIDVVWKSQVLQRHPGLPEGRQESMVRTCVSPVQSRVGREVGDDYQRRKPLTSTLAKAMGLF